MRRVRLGREVVDVGEVVTWEDGLETDSTGREMREVCLCQQKKVGIGGRKGRSRGEEREEREEREGGEWIPFRVMISEDGFARGYRHDAWARGWEEGDEKVAKEGEGGRMVISVPVRGGGGRSATVPLIRAIASAWVSCPAWIRFERGVPFLIRENGGETASNIGWAPARLLRKRSKESASKSSHSPLDPAPLAPAHLESARLLPILLSGMHAGREREKERERAASAEGRGKWRRMRHCFFGRGGEAEAVYVPARNGPVWVSEEGTVRDAVGNRTKGMRGEDGVERVGVAGYGLVPIREAVEQTWKGVRNGTWMGEREGTGGGGVRTAERGIWREFRGSHSERGSHLERGRERRLGSLTPAERDCVLKAASGKGVGTVAEERGSSRDAVWSHLYSAVSKLGAEEVPPSMWHVLPSSVKRAADDAMRGKVVGAGGRRKEDAFLGEGERDGERDGERNGEWKEGRGEKEERADRMGAARLGKLFAEKGRRAAQCKSDWKACMAGDGVRSVSPLCLPLSKGWESVAEDSLAEDFPSNDGGKKKDGLRVELLP